MQITIPEDVEASIRERAKAFGFSNVDDYVLSLLYIEGPPSSTRPMPYEEWRRELDAFLRGLTPANPNVDDSRESIYPDR